MRWKKKIDLVFVLDESSSIKGNGFRDIKNFAKGIVEKMPIGKDKMQVGLMTFSSSPLVRFNLNNNPTQHRVLMAIDSVEQRGGNTYTHAALQTLVETFQQKSGGRYDAIKVAIIETDGASKYPEKTKAAAEAARAQGIILMAVGVGDYDKKEINDIASDPDSEHVFTVADFDQLSTIVKQITKTACSGKAPVVGTTVETVTMDPMKVPKFCDDVPMNERDKSLYMIDPDGPHHGAEPFRVECDFSGTGPPVTILHNKQEKRTCVEGCQESDRGCFVQTIQYHASGYQARTFVDHAKHCTQEVIYDCYNAALDYRTHNRNGPMTWWTDRYGTKMNYWPGGPKSGGCACGKHRRCARRSEKCNCDKRDKKWRTDKGTVTDKDALPIKEIAVGDVSRPGQKGCFTVGSLRCTAP